MLRRAFLENIGGGAAGLLGASLIDLRRAGEFAAAASEQQPWEFFSADQARIMDAVSAQIVPTDDTPGAREARVTRFADHVLATFLKDWRDDVVSAFGKLDAFSRGRKGKLSFADRKDADQLEVLKAFEKKDGRSFGSLRHVTMAGMFSHPEHGGNFDRVGWKLIGYENRYSWAPPFGFYDR